MIWKARKGFTEKAKLELRNKTKSDQKKGRASQAEGNNFYKGGKPKA